MSVSIKEVLDNAEYNLTVNYMNPLASAIGKEQLENASKLLNVGYYLSDDFDKSWEEFEAQSGRDKGHE